MSSESAIGTTTRYIGTYDPKMIERVINSLFFFYSHISRLLEPQTISMLK